MRPPIAGRVPLVLLLIAVASSVAGCAVNTGPPSPTPADFPGIASVLARHGITVAGVVSGDAGCRDSDLTKVAVSFGASGLDQAEPTLVHAYLFRDQAAFDRRRAQVDACLRSYVRDPADLGLIEAPPWVVAGPGPWAPEFAAALREALTEALEQGG